MCGICGFVSTRNTDINNLKYMNDSIEHRGPDDCGEYIARMGRMTVGLGHRRLSVLDLSQAGHQPMFYGDDVGIVYNGEIYNFREIRDRLIAKGYVFHSDCDTEVILAAYLDKGIESVDDFNGMFAFALLDFRTQEIFLVRDRMGKKPLYLYDDGEDIVFSSELKPIYRYPHFRKELRTDLMARYMYRGYFGGRDTVFHNVERVLPGHIIRYKIQDIGYSKQDICYWNVPEVYDKYKNSGPDDFATAKEELRELLCKAVKRRLIADVPVGTFLSGGIDSSLITAIAQAVSDQKIKTYSIGFYNDKDNEANYASKVADALGTDHHELYVDEHNYREMLDDMCYYFDEPHADNSAIPTMLVSKFARQDVTVALSGDAGDELFCGYDSYDKMAYMDKMYPYAKATQFLARGIYRITGKNIKSKRSDKINMFFGQPVSVTQLLTKYDIDKAEQYVLGEQAGIAFDEADLREESYQIRKMLLDQITFMTDDILAKVDRASMRFSLECRSPLLDPDIIKFSYSIPQKFKYKDKKHKKYILQELLADYVPRKLFERPKHGFCMSVRSYLDDNDDLRKYIEPSYLKKQGLFDAEAINKLYSSFLTHSYREAHNVLWKFYVFQMWYERFMT